MPVRVAINGFGRIGRNVFRAVHASNDSQIEIVALNDLTDNDMLGHLLRYDSVHGIFSGEVSVNAAGLKVDGRGIRSRRRSPRCCCTSPSAGAAGARLVLALLVS